MILAVAADACVSCSPANSSLNADLALFFAFFSLMGGLAGLAAASASAGAGSAGASAPPGPGGVPNVAPSTGVPHGARPQPGAGASSVTRNPDGSLDLTFPDGRSMHLPQSHSTQYFNNEYAYDGNYTAHEYPGGETHEYAHGPIVTRFSDGSWIGSSPDGTWWTKASDHAPQIFHDRDGTVINKAFGDSPAGKPGGLSGSVNDGEGRTSSGTVPAGHEPSGSTGSVPWDDPL